MKLFSVAVLISTTLGAVISKAEMDNGVTLAQDDSPLSKREVNFKVNWSSKGGSNCELKLQNACGCNKTVKIGSGYCKNLSGDITKTVCGGTLKLTEDGDSWRVSYGGDDCSLVCSVGKETHSAC